MSDLMGNHCGQFRLVRHSGHSAPGDENIAARRCERIDDIGVDDGKPELDLGPVGTLGHALSYLVHILVELVMLIKSVLAQYPGRQRPAKDNFRLYIVISGKRFGLLVPLFPEVTPGKARQRRTMNCKYRNSRQSQDARPETVFPTQDIFHFPIPARRKLIASSSFILTASMRSTPLKFTLYLSLTRERSSASPLAAAAVVNADA